MISAALLLKTNWPFIRNPSTPVTGSRYTVGARQTNRGYQAVDEATSARMLKVRRSGTAAELKVARILTQLSIRYSTTGLGLPGSPDFANRRRHWVVFVHGCFWHRHKNCHRATTPKRNRSMWLKKFRGNRRRDELVEQELRRKGFDVIVVWECELQHDSRVRRRLARSLLSTPILRS